MKQAIGLVTFLALSVAAGPVRAQTAGGPQAGLALAQQVCSECHAVLRGQAPSPNPRAPTFSELAATPGMTSAALSVALTTPHAGMPMFRLTAEEREDVIAYILSLR
ncbi:MAG: c-type cytochrome [Hyphomicrobiales bacterium]